MWGAKRNLDDGEIESAVVLVDFSWVVWIEMEMETETEKETETESLGGPVWRGGEWERDGDTNL
jgi:hypothetical protein